MSNDSLDSKWSLEVRERDHHKCRLWIVFNDCSIQATQAHHLFTRNYKALRHNVDNGISVCWSCHNKIENHSQFLEIYQKVVSRDILEKLVKLLAIEGKFVKLD